MRSAQATPPAPPPRMRVPLEEAPPPPLPSRSARAPGGGKRTRNSGGKKTPRNLPEPSRELPEPSREPPGAARGPREPPGAAAMSDSGQSPAPGARRRCWNREKEPEGGGERREVGEEPAGTLQKTPIILAKPPAERQPPPTAPKAGPAQAPPPPAPAPPIVLMKARGEEPRGGGGASGSSGEGPAQAPPMEREGPRPTQPVYQLHSRGLAPPAALDPAQAQARLAAPEKMKTSIKLVDEQMNWCDSALEFLLEQTDVLVVGALGLQGTGKSTVLSLLAGNQPEEDPRSFVFRPQPPELRERGGAQTGGIDLFVTQERVLFLDTQPILSPAHLDHLINNDRKLPPEFALPHAYVETQSLQIAAFLFTVCHVVLLVQDWFTDLGLYRFLQTAEMVKPPTPSPSHDCSGGGAEEPSEYYPHLVFVQTRAPPECFSPRRLGQMQRVLGQLMAHSRLKYRGSLSMRELLPAPPSLPPSPPEPEVNLFLLPPLEEEPEDALPRAGGGGALFPALPPFRGRGGWGGLLARLRGRVLAAARSQLSHSLLTERNWFHYAARIWDGVKKSSALAEYGRLLG
ncbi:LOW QUALITY PROTEIN: nonsense-mediated mRNA decay factor SMG9 [Poecile atricapillus]|uniref:LOW QUALITY PROTEIN: nonsense-mediated mRNA decay factor SMG9 n=1 Tax=Poecile atricapillus TaxID=48891 RepID=UPI002738B4A5|nr:LOW QUALITY PROTEIN: nonsense-mediated mRNA decay factor SMG9 [Poecile atricapillus]